MSPFSLSRWRWRVMYVPFLRICRMSKTEAVFMSAVFTRFDKRRMTGTTVFYPQKFRKNFKRWVWLGTRCRRQTSNRHASSGSHCIEFKCSSSFFCFYEKRGSLVLALNYVMKGLLSFFRAEMVCLFSDVFFCVFGLPRSSVCRPRMAASRRWCKSPPSGDQAIWFYLVDDDGQFSRWRAFRYLSNEGISDCFFCSQFNVARMYISRGTLGLPSHAGVVS